MTIIYGCCVGSYEKVSRYLMPRISGPLITMHNQTCIAEAYNAIIHTVRGSKDVEALVLLHDDLEILDIGFENKIRETLTNSSIGLIGVAGAINTRSLAWWNYGAVGSVLSDTTNIDFGVRSGAVDAIDGCVMVLSPWTINNLLFDEQYDGFHGYDCDIARQVLRHQKSAVVIDTKVHHHTVLGWKSVNTYTSWTKADHEYRMKWRL